MVRGSSRDFGTPSSPISATIKTLWNDFSRTQWQQTAYRDAVLSCVNDAAINLCVFIRTVAKGIINLTKNIPTRNTDLRQTKDVLCFKAELK